MKEFLKIFYIFCFSIILIITINLFISGISVFHETGMVLIVFLLLIFIVIQGFKFRFENRRLKKQIERKNATLESIELHEKSLQNLQVKIQGQEKILKDIEKKEESTKNVLLKESHKVERLRDLYDALERGIESYCNSTEFSPLLYFEKHELDLLAPTALLNLNCYNYQDLKKRFDDNQKQIKILLDKFQANNMNKSNRIILQIMILSLSAELQNTLIKLKYGKREDARSDIKMMIVKYISIISDGTQNISESIRKFLFAIEELYLNAIDIEYEYYIKKEQAQQEQRELRALMREEQEEQRRLKEEEEKIQKEKEKYLLERDRLEAMLLEAQTEEEKKSIEDDIEVIDSQISKIDLKHEEIVNLQNGKAGNVYIISNIGSFGENIFKIGMTRRLDPQDRVDELSSASVPFRFDVHSFIFSQNAPELEAELHRRLNDKRVNKVNSRKEFFNVSLDELENLVYNVYPNAEFNRTILASEFRQSQSMN